MLLAVVCRFTGPTVCSRRNAETLLHLGDSLNDLKHFKKAAKVYKEALALPGTPTAEQARLRLHLADSLVNSKRPHKALRHYHKALDLLQATAVGAEGSTQHATAEGLEAAALVGLVHAKRQLADWSEWGALLERAVAATKRELDAGRRSPMTPYHTLFLSEPDLQLRVALDWASRTVNATRAAHPGVWPLWRDCAKREEPPDPGMSCCVMRCCPWTWSDSSG